MPMAKTFADIVIFLGPFGSSTTVKAINNILVGLHIAGTAQAMAIGLRAGVDVELMIKAIANGSGGSRPVRHSRALDGRAQASCRSRGSAPGLAHYLERGKELGKEVGVDTPLIDCLIDIIGRPCRMIGERDVAAIIEIFRAQSQQ